LDDLTFLSPPRIEPSVFARILTAAGSSAAPDSAALYATCLRHSLDPAVALAFFAHESSYGKRGSAVVTRNWGNIRIPSRRPPWGKVRNPHAPGALAVYDSWLDSLDAWCMLIASVYVPSGRDTVRRAIPVYAPSSDGNAPAAYIAAVLNLVALWSRPKASSRFTVTGPAPANVRASWSMAAPIIGKLQPGQVASVDHFIADGGATPRGDRRWAAIVAPIAGYVAAFLLSQEDA
jgi:hypothetical protein